MAKTKPDWVARSKPVLWLACLLPLAWMLWAGAANRLGPDPAKTLVDQAGLWAFRMLLLSLVMTPLRYLSGISAWVRYRRLLGLFAFFYALVHVAAYAFLLFGGRWGDISAELLKRPYVLVGATAFLLFLPLVVTSTRGWQRRLGMRWIQLHKLVYALALLVLIHFAWIKKLGFVAIWPYVAALILLLGIRLWKRLAKI